ncbi:type II toxin-antitoxin system ParD family antitoxin [Tistrella mobilis]|uniref:Addiction module antidote protein, CC2985 family n=1 Tax=Tistrella mobilis (strain KA081020-065) TaxID=1110502 RepID=I3TPW2_TISMK|nr:type II toxin-antitoxin system ParD family antitoxin [Tistrella mobilis]AFK54800.1 addiction module antidote protein, CC2985 family [Tistrella mobilis KA081020-065]
MAMATMNVSVTDQMKIWVEGQVESGRYGNASDYIRDLIRRDQERRAALADIQRLIDEGLASGSSGLSMQDVLTEARRRAALSADNGL